MMPARPHAVALKIQYMGQPRQRKPVSRSAGGKSPGYTVEIDAGANIRVFRNINLIVEIKKTILEQGRKHPNGDRGQGHANPPYLRPVPMCCYDLFDARDCKWEPPQTAIVFDSVVG